VTIQSLFTTASSLDLVNTAQVYIALIGFGVALPACLVLNRKLMADEPGARPFKWGFYITVATLVSSVANLVVMVRFHSYSGEFTWLELVYYMVLAMLCGWALSRDRRAFLIMTVCTLSPFVWIANGWYLKYRWQDLAPRAAAGE